MTRPPIEPPLGLESKRVRVVAYDVRWPALFESEARRLEALIAAAGLPALALKHVGSTAVPGLAAKPVLDLAAGRNPEVPARDYVAILVTAGYVHRGESGLPGREFFRKGKLRTHHLHLVEREGPHWRRYLIFRDALRADPALRDAYAKLKQHLMHRFPQDREAYIEGKTAFVQQVLHVQRGG
jgi:GrpB-like predicted nucleotidyltransferase (UPF0157 family)